MMDATEGVALIHQKSDQHQILQVVNASNHLRPWDGGVVGTRGVGAAGKQVSS